MSKVFLKKGVLQLVNGGYVSDSKENPVVNLEFLEAQKLAHRLVLIADKMEGKTFVAKEVDNLRDLISEVDEELAAEKTVKFVDVPEVKKGKTTLALEKEALEFVNSMDKKGLAEKINEKLQEFNIIKEFEEFGLFFDQGISKLEKIYSIEEITKAAEKVYSVLD